MNSETSNFTNLRKRHNLIKRRMIELSCKKLTLKNNTLSVFDVSVGRFGDLHKYISIPNIKYIYAIDPDEKSIEEAKRRVSTAKLNNKKIEIKIDTISNSYVEFGQLFDLVVCNFTLHYFFEKEEMLSNAIRNISLSIRNSGFFIGTTIGNFIQTHNFKERISEHYSIVTKNYNENEIYGNSYEMKLNNCRYEFNQTEYLVDLTEFVNVCKKFNLKLIKLTPFGIDKHLQKHENDVSQLYYEFIFVKI